MSTSNHPRASLPAVAEKAFIHKPESTHWALKHSKQSPFAPDVYFRLGHHSNWQSASGMVVYGAQLYIFWEHEMTTPLLKIRLRQKRRNEINLWCSIHCRRKRWVTEPYLQPTRLLFIKRFESPITQMLAAVQNTSSMGLNRQYTILVDSPCGHQSMQLVRILDRVPQTFRNECLINTARETSYFETKSTFIEIQNQHENSDNKSQFCCESF